MPGEALISHSHGRTNLRMGPKHRIKATNTAGQADHRRLLQDVPQSWHMLAPQA